VGADVPRVRLCRPAADPRLGSNNDRVRARDWMLPLLRERFAAFSAGELARASSERPALRADHPPQDLFDDPHLAATGGLAPLHMPADASGAGRAIDTHAPLLPLAMDGARLPLREGPPALGADTRGPPPPGRGCLRSCGCRCGGSHRPRCVGPGSQRPARARHNSR
jgi:crotonobetainyl-CoA:carnitine CoA-transferase CaiB-like acyl-CoA transferase